MHCPSFAPFTSAGSFECELSPDYHPLSTGLAHQLESQHNICVPWLQALERCHHVSSLWVYFIASRQKWAQVVSDSPDPSWWDQDLPKCPACLCQTHMEPRSHQVRLRWGAFLHLGSSQCVLRFCPVPGVQPDAASYDFACKARSWMPRGAQSSSHLFWVSLQLLTLLSVLWGCFGPGLSKGLWSIS